MRAIKAVKPGRANSRGRPGDRGVRKPVRLQRGSDFTGHGYRRDLPQRLVVLHYDQPSVETVLEPGMTFTIEPMINPARWTTRSGTTAGHQGPFKGTAQFEHTLVVTEDGADIPTLAP